MAILNNIIDDLISTISKNSANWFSKYRELNSVGIAFKEIGGKKTDTLCIRFSVQKKIDTAPLLPTFVSVSNSQVLTDVVERTYLPIANATPINNKRNYRLDPIVPGISVAGVSAEAGTIGMIVKLKDDKDSKPKVLSNWHVLIGEHGSNGNETLQPSRRDSKIPPNKKTMGKVVNSYLGLEGDCAISSVDGRGVGTSIYGLNVTPNGIITKKDVDDAFSSKNRLKLVKSGRTTGVTYGVINAINVIAPHLYGNKSYDINSFEIEPNTEKPPQGGKISNGGDSGSCWLLDDSTIVAGLHFAASSQGHAQACYIESVFNVLGIDIYP